MISLTPEYLRPKLLHRERNSHKHDYGRLLIIAGCETMPGAAVLATGGALQSGCGLVRLHSTARALQAVVNSFPSAMLSEEYDDFFHTVPEKLERYNTIAIGPGLGWSPGTLNSFMDLLAEARSRHIPMVLDADALNILSVLSDWTELIPAGSVLTPHKGELKRLLPSKSDEERETLAWELCAETNCCVVMKGYHSRVFTPNGTCYVNTTGGPGMAKGGSGDVLTGLIGGLMARGYSAEDAATLGVWIHGYAGDVLSAERTEEAFSSRDLIDKLYLGFQELYQ
ncbi:MAG: NAD(P)H-hydrate dehydratase [Bacteroidales bacterium]|nr:NAD(P)H-hydrate dehydratase [Bacteroidales bacterium]